jgi:hypothetical protein
MAMTYRYSRLVVFLVPVLAAALWAWAGEAAPPAEPARAAPAPESPAARLFKPRPFPGIADPDTTLGEALRSVGAMYDATFDVDEQAFRDEELHDVSKKPLGVEVPKMAGASLDRVLRKLLAQLSAPSGATYMVRVDHVEITTRRAQRVEVWGRYGGPYLPLVHADFEGRPLADALQDLSHQSGVSVVVDARAADKAKTPVSASFLNLPLDTAVRTLAEMAGLKSALNDNTIYVSTEARQVVVRPDADSPNAGGPIPASALSQQALSEPVRVASFDRRPLQEALQDVLKPTDMRLVVDAARAGEKARAPVTANLEGVSVEAAVRLLADMAGLRPVIYENVVYLTTKDNATGFIKEHPAAANPALGGIGGIGGLGGALGGMPSAPR